MKMQFNPTVRRLSISFLVLTAIVVALYVIERRTGAITTSIGEAVRYYSHPAHKPPSPQRPSFSTAQPPNANRVSQPTEIRSTADMKVVFVKGTALMSANADGSNVQMLVSNGLTEDSYPVWSPAGDKIVYWTSGPSTDDSKILLNLVVITADGHPVNTIPVIEAESGPWLLFHGVDIGWYGNDAVFAKGLVNTVVGDYRILDVRSGQELHKYSGTNFGTCEAQAKVGWENLSLSGYSVAVNGSPVYTIPSGSTVTFGITWSTDCSRLVFIESTIENVNATTLVVVSGASVEAKLPKPAKMFSFAPIESSFMIGASVLTQEGQAGGALLYDTTTHTLRPAPDILHRLQERAAEEAQLMKTLGGESPNWYRPSQPLPVSASQKTDVWQRVSVPPPLGRISRICLVNASSW
jgi:hypothetical protein